MSSDTELEKAATEAATKNIAAGRNAEQMKTYLLADLKPVRPLLPPAVFAGSFVLIFVVLVLTSMIFLNPLGWGMMMPFQRLTMFSTLAAAAALLAFGLSRQMVPGTRVFPPGSLVTGLLVLLSLVGAALFQVRSESDFMRNGQRCLQAGFPYAVPAALLFAVILRKGAMLSPIWSGVLTGMLAGLVSTTALEVHCPDQDFWHILIFHLGFTAAGAAAGAGITWLARILRKA